MNKKLMEELKATNLLDAEDGLREFFDNLLNSAMENFTKGLKDCDDFDQELLENETFMNGLTIWACMLYGKLFNDKAIELQSVYVVDFLPDAPEEGEEE